MSNIWVLQTGEPLHIDEGDSRPMRAMNLVNTLIARGHYVTLFSADFDHKSKKHRYGSSQKIIVSEKLTIQLIYSPGYKSNIGFQRLYDHFILALNLRTLLKSDALCKPDLGFIGYPPIEASFVMVRWLKNYKIPSVVDVKDQWPDYFIESFPIHFHFLARIIFAPYFYLAAEVMSNATAFCSMSKSYLKWMSRVGKRQLTKGDMIAPLTLPLSTHKEKDLIDARIWWENLGVSTESKRRLCFVGSLSPAFDFTSIQRVALEFREEGIECQFVICGAGSSEAEVRTLMAGLDNVIFPGWIDPSKIHVLAMCSSGALAPYKNTKNFTDNIPNKIVDSLAHGLPVFTTLSGEVKEMLEASNAGIYYSSSDYTYFKKSIVSLFEDQNFHSNLSSNAIKLYENRFSAVKVYGQLVDRLEGMVESVNHRGD
jgi:glycosyltransferase involved in cell wall biosynthesis